MDGPLAVRYHRLVDGDLGRAFRYYQQEAGKELADAFYAEFLRLVGTAAGNYGRFSPFGHGLRRANLRRFPYHFLFRIRANDILVLVLRHNKTHPARGLHRE